MSPNNPTSGSNARSRTISWSASVSRDTTPSVPSLTLGSRI
jgi:hypothetical protein